MPQQNLGTASVEVVADLSKLDSSLRAALTSANTAGQQIGARLSEGVKSGLGDPAQAVGYFKNIQQHAQQFRIALENLGTSLEQHRESFNQFGGDLQSLGGKMSIGITAPLVALGAASLKSSADIDSLFRGLTAVAGSAEGARRQFAELVEVAKLPGLGLEEAVQGSIRLQAFGFSSKEAKDALLNFGNAIATVGGGKAELDRVIVQLGQMAGAGKVLTQDLRPIIQTVPQVAEILKKSFGADVLSDPAKRFDELGLSAKDVVKVLVAELGKLPKVTGGLKNDMENFADSMKQSLGRLGDDLGKLVGPAMNGTAAAVDGLVDAFMLLPTPIRFAVEGFAGIVAAAGPAIYALGGMASGASDMIGLAGRWAEWSRNAALAAEAARGVAVAGGAAQAAITGMGGAATASVAGIGAMSTAIGVIGGIGALGALALLIAKANEAPPTLAEMERSLGNVSVALKEGAKDAQEYGRLVESAFRRAQQAMSGPEMDSKRQAEALAFLTAEAKKLGVEIDRGSMSFSEYTAAIREAMSEVSKGQTPTAQLSKGTKDLIDRQKELQEAYAPAKLHVSELTKAVKEGKPVTVALELANKELKSAYDALHPSVEKVSKAQVQHAKEMTMVTLPAFEAMQGRVTQNTQAMEAFFDSLKDPAADKLPQKLGNMTATIENGVRVIRGASVVNKEYTSTIKDIGGAAMVAAEQIKVMTGEMQLAATAAKNAIDMASGFRASGGFGVGYGSYGSGGSGTLSPATTSGRPMPGTQPGDIKYISGAGGSNMPSGGPGSFNALEMHLWTEEEILAAEEFREALAALAAAGLRATANEVVKLQRQMRDTGQTIEEVVEQWVAMGEAERSARTAMEGFRKATDIGSESLQDMEEQLWRLIDAGQGNSMAAWTLRTKIQELTGGYESQTRAAAATGAAVRQAGAAMSQAADVIVSGLQRIQTQQARLADTGPVATTTRTTTSPTSTTTARLYSDLAPDPYYGTLPSAPSPYIPNSPYGVTPQTFDSSPYQAGIGSVNFYLPDGSAEAVGRRVTEILKQRAGFA